MAIVSLYNPLLIDHYHNPRLLGVLEPAHFVVELIHQACGDVVCMSGAIQDGILIDVRQKGSGCVISQAYASLLAEYVKGKAIDFILGITSEGVCVLGKSSLGPNRLECALVALHALKQGIRNYVRSH